MILLLFNRIVLVLNSIDIIIYVRFFLDTGKQPNRQKNVCFHSVEGKHLENLLCFEVGLKRELVKRKYLNSHKILARYIAKSHVKIIRYMIFLLSWHNPKDFQTNRNRTFYWNLVSSNMWRKSKQFTTNGITTIELRVQLRRQMD